jgi:hypothetical protein
MIESLINKVLLITFILCLLNGLKHIWNVINNLREDVPSKYTISTKERFLLGLSLAYIITTFFTGIGI